MHVEVDVKCIETKFGGRGLFGIGVMAPFKNDQISLSTHGLYMVIKKFNRSELAQKIHVSKD